MDIKFQSLLHEKYFQFHLNTLPYEYRSLDTNRMTVLYFTISGLSLLNKHDIYMNNKDEILKWIYSQECINTGGFQGSPCNYIKEGHLAMTYTALCILSMIQYHDVTINDNHLINKIDQLTTLKWIKSLQLSNGSFKASKNSGENDMRFIYCAVAICYYFNKNFNYININLIIKYIKSCISYDGGISLRPNEESHGGSTYTAIATLILLDKLHIALNIKQYNKLIKWCILQQGNGYKGRINKDEDTCYSFWIGATLNILLNNPPNNNDQYNDNIISYQNNYNFVLSCQHNKLGGFGKYKDVMSDILHSYFGLAGISLMYINKNIEIINPMLGIPNYILKKEQKKLNKVFFFIYLILYIFSIN